MDEQLVVKYIRTKKKVRKIVTYREHNDLRKYHEAVAKYLQKNTFNSIFAKAYVPKSSIFSNAKAHMYNDIFIKMDIRDFFPNINHEYMAKSLYHEINKIAQISNKECHDIVRKCSIGEKGLPLGLVSSPGLANLYLKEFDGLFYGQLKKMCLKNVIYTRYADDLVVSFKYCDDYEKYAEKIVAQAEHLLQRFCLKLNMEKLQIVNLKKSNHVRITGVSITRNSQNYRHISVGKKLKNEIFWKAIELYDNPEGHNMIEREQLKGLFSFVLSIEKRGVEESFSEGMINLLKIRGFNSLKELINTL
ncbi:MAG: hypothetical protein IJA07_08060 [Agathobacter sp.]|nr:hypothetical protein [Agathobacter sp.]